MEQDRTRSRIMRTAHSLFSLQPELVELPVLTSQLHLVLA